MYLNFLLNGLNGGNFGFNVGWGDNNVQSFAPSYNYSSAFYSGYGGFPTIPNYVGGIGAFHSFGYNFGGGPFYYRNPYMGGPFGWGTSSPSYPSGSIAGAMRAVGRMAAGYDDLANPGAYRARYEARQQPKYDEYYRKAQEEIDAQHAKIEENKRKQEEKEAGTDTSTPPVPPPPPSHEATPPAGAEPEPPVPPEAGAGAEPANTAIQPDAEGKYDIGGVKFAGYDSSSFSVAGSEADDVRSRVSSLNGLLGGVKSDIDLTDANIRSELAGLIDGRLTSLEDSLEVFRATGGDDSALTDIDVYIAAQRSALEELKTPKEAPPPEPEPEPEPEVGVEAPPPESPEPLPPPTPPTFPATVVVPIDSVEFATYAGPVLSDASSEAMQVNGELVKLNTLLGSTTPEGLTTSNLKLGIATAIESSLQGIEDSIKAYRTVGGTDTALAGVEAHIRVQRANVDALRSHIASAPPPSPDDGDSPVVTDAGVVDTVKDDKTTDRGLV